MEHVFASSFSFVEFLSFSDILRLSLCSLLLKKLCHDYFNCMKVKLKLNGWVQKQIASFGFLKMIVPLSSGMVRSIEMNQCIFCHSRYVGKITTSIGVYAHPKCIKEHVINVYFLPRYGTSMGDLPRNFPLMELQAYSIRKGAFTYFAALKNKHPLIPDEHTIMGIREKSKFWRQYFSKHVLPEAMKEAKFLCRKFEVERIISSTPDFAPTPVQNAVRRILMRVNAKDFLKKVQRIHKRVAELKFHFPEATQGWDTTKALKFGLQNLSCQRKRIKAKLLTQFIFESNGTEIERGVALEYACTNIKIITPNMLLENSEFISMRSEQEKTKIDLKEAELRKQESERLKMRSEDTIVVTTRKRKRQEDKENRNPSLSS